MRERAPWYRRRVGVYGWVAAALTAASGIVGFVTHESGGWRSAQAGLLVAGAAAYLAGLVRSPD